MRVRSFLLPLVSVVALAGAAAHAQTLAEQIEEQSDGAVQGHGNFFRYRIDGLDPSLYDAPVVKVVQPRKFFIGEKPELTVMVQGGNRPYAFSLIGPALPQGLSFDPRKGNFVGSTKLPGTASYVLAVQDARGRVAQSEPFTVTFLDDFDESQFHAYPVEAFVDGRKLVSPQPIFDGSATTDVAAAGLGSTVAVRFDQPIRAKTAVVAFSTEAAFGACSYDLEAKDPEGRWTQVHRASSLASGGVVQAFNLMPTPRSGFVSDEWRVTLTSGCHMRLSELRIASAPPNPPPAWQTPEGLLVAVGPVPLGVSIVAPEQSPYSNVPTRFELAGGSTLPAGFGLRENGDLTGPDGEGFPYGRIDFRVRSTDGIGYWTERSYFITPDALPARIVYPVSLVAGNAIDPRHAMNDGLVDASAEGVTVAAGGKMLFDYGRFVRVTGGTMLAGENVGSMLLEAEAGPDQWVDPALVGGIAKRWRLVNQSAADAFVREARLDEADYNHPPSWKTAEGPWVVNERRLSFAGRRDADGNETEAAVVTPGLRLTVEAQEESIYSEVPTVLKVAPGTTVPAGLVFDGTSIAAARGDDLPAGRMSVRLQATDDLGYSSQRSFVFNPASVRANTVMPSVTGPTGDVSLLLNDGATDKVASLAAGQSFEWDFGRYVVVVDKPVVTADKPEAIVLEAFANGGWVQPNTVDGIAKRWRARATAAVSVSEYRLDGAGAILAPAWSPAGTLRIVGPNGFGTSVDRQLPIASTARNPYASSATTVTVVGQAPAGFAFDGTVITVPAGEALTAGRVEVVLKAEDARGISSVQTYPFSPLSVRASTLVPQVRDPSNGDVYFQLYDGVVGAEARSIHLEAGQSIVFGYQRYASVQAPNVVDATDSSLLAFEAETADGWVAAENVGSVAKRFRVRATGAVDLREFRLDGAPAPGAPIWSTSTGPYVVSDSGIDGTARFTVALSARVDNLLAEPDPSYSVRGDLPEGFAYADRVITAPRGSQFASGRQVVTIRASDSTGFFTDRTFVFNPESVPAQPMKPDVRDPDDRDVFGIMSDGRTVTDRAEQAADMGVALADGQSVTLDYGRTVNAGRGAVLNNLGGSVVVEAQTAHGWVPAASADWIATRFRVRAVGATFLSEIRLDGLPAQPGPLWATYQTNQSGRIAVGAASSLDLSATPRSTFSDGRTVTFSAPRSLAAGFSLAGSKLAVPAGENFPAGLYYPVVRATDSVGVWQDFAFPFEADAARALFVRSSIRGPDGNSVYTILTDGAVSPADAGVAMAAGDAVVFDYGRYVYLFDPTQFAASGAHVFEAETVDGWVPAGDVGGRAKRFRFRATQAGVIREARLDGLEVQGAPRWNTPGDLRTVDQAGLTLTLSTTLRSRFGAPIVYSAPAGLPAGFGLSAEGVLTAPPGESFPSGAVSLSLRATDDVGFATDRTFPFAPATVRAKTVIPTNIADAAGANVTQVLNDDVKGASAPGVVLTAGQTVTWSFPRYVKIVAAENVVDATAPAALVLETDGGSAGWVPAASLDTGKRFRIRATANVTVREYRLDGVGAFVLPSWATAAQPWEVSPTAINGQTGLQLQVAANNNSPFPGAIAYSLVPGASLPSGFSLSATGLITVPSAEVFPAGRVDVPVRATDTVGNVVDRTFLFHPKGVAAATVAPKTVVAEGADLRIAMLDGRTEAADASVTLSAGQSLVFDYGTQWVRIAANSVFDVAPAGAVLETKAGNGSWVQMGASPASFPAAVQDQGGRVFRLRQVTGTSTLREARLGGMPALGPAWTTPATPYAVNQTTIVGMSPAGLTLPLAATKSAITVSAVSYAWAPGFTPPTGFSLLADGRLTVPPGESFPYGRVAAAVRATTDDYTSDRVLPFNPATVRLASVAPDTVLDKDGNSVVVPLYDGATGTGAGVRSVSLNAGESIVWTFPRYVQNLSAAVADGVNLGSLVLETERTPDEWVAPSSVDSIGRRWRVRATAAAVIREYRLDGAGTFLSPVWVTAGTSRVVSETTIADAAPARLSLQLQATNKSLRPSDPLSYAVAPGSSLPEGFALTSAGMLTVPKATEFKSGNIVFAVRVTDTLGFFTDQSFNFYPENFSMTALMPTTVVGPDGADVFVPLYSGLNDTPISLPVGQSITWTFPRFVSPSANSFYSVSANRSDIVLETPAQDGTWTVIHSVASAGGTASQAAYGRIYRLRNASGGNVTVSSARLGGVIPQAPTWHTMNTAVWGVSETQIGNNTVTIIGQAHQLSATKVFTGAESLSFALKPGSPELPEGFSLTPSGILTVPKGENFPGGLAEISVRAQDTRGFYADRTFQYVPAQVPASAVAPSSVLDPSGADAFTILYDGNFEDRVVTLGPGEAITWTFPRYVSVSREATNVLHASANGPLYLESLRADGKWQVLETYAVSLTTLMGRTSAAAAPYNIGRQWRLRNPSSTAVVRLSEFRIDGANGFQPTITTSTGPWEVSQTNVVGASPTALSLQLAGTTLYGGTNLPLNYALAPNSLQLPAGFGLSTSGLLVVPQGESFPGGFVQSTVRATDVRGFYVDKDIKFYPASVQARSVAPTSVVDANGADVYSQLYDGAREASSKAVTIAPGAAVTYTFPRYVSLSYSSELAIRGSGATLVVERPDQSGGWTVVEQVLNGNYAGLSGDISNRVSKVFRLRNASATDAVVSEWRLDSSIARTPVWTTSPGPYNVSDTAISGQTGLTLALAADTASSSSSLTYALVPGTTLPSGYSVSSAGTIEVEPASAMPSGRVDVPVRVTDGHGLYTDRTFTFLPAGAVNASTIPPMAVTGPTGENLLPVVYDGREDTSYVLQPGQSVVYSWDRFVRISLAGYVTATQPTCGGNPLSLQSLAADGQTWKTISTYAQSPSCVMTASAPASADANGKIFRILNTGTQATTLYEARLDAAPSYGIVMAINQGTQTVAEAIAGTSPASLSLQLAAAMNHPKSTMLKWTFGGVLPIDFTLTQGGLLTVPSGPNFPFGLVEVPVIATDDLGFAQIAKLSFVPDHVAANAILPRSVTGPNGEDLFRSMYDGRTETGASLAKDQSITYTFDRFVEATSIARSRFGAASNLLVVETPNQVGGWSSALTILNSGNGGADYRRTVSKVFRLRNTSVTPVLVQDFPLDGANYLTPSISTSVSSRLVTENGIAGQPEGSFSLQLAASNNNPNGGGIVWSAAAPLPVGFTLTPNGVLTAPKPADFAGGYVEAKIRATDQGGFFTEATFPFRPEYATAKSVAPVSVTGPSGQDLLQVLYDGQAATSFDIGNSSVTYTYDRWVQVTDIGLTLPGYSSTGNTNLNVEARQADGTWAVIGNLYRQNGSTAGGLSDGSRNVAKAFRVRDIRGVSTIVSELRLDNATSYGLQLATTQEIRFVDESIANTNPPTLSLQLKATSPYPAPRTFTWSPRGSLPAGFTLTSEGTLTVPKRQDLPAGYVPVAVRVSDQLGFMVDGTYPFVPVSAPAKTVMPSSVRGSSGQDVFQTLYDGDAATSFTLAPGAAVTYTYPRHVRVDDLTASAYTGTWGAGTTLVMQVPALDGSWVTIYTFTGSAQNTWQSIAAAPNATAYSQSTVFRVVNIGSSAAALSEFRLDNPSHYGISWGQIPPVAFVGPSSITDSNGGGLAIPNTSGRILTPSAVSGYPGGAAVTFSWAPGFTPPDGFVLSGGQIQIPAGADFPAGRVELKVRAADDKGLFFADRTLTFAPWSTRAATVAPVSLVDRTGTDLRVGLYDDDASTYATVATKLQPGDSVVWTYPAWTNIQANAVAVSDFASVLTLERASSDGTWQAAETRAVGGGATAGLRGDAYPSKVWRLRNTGTAPASIMEWRLDGALSYAPALQTTTAMRYVTATSIVDAIGGTAASAGTSGLTLTLGGTVASPGGGVLSFSWAAGFTPPAGFVLTPAGELSIPARDDMPNGPVMLSVTLTDPRGFAVTRVLNFVADSPRARDKMVPGATMVVGTNGADLFNGLVDGSTATAATLQPGEAITWTFPSHVNLQSASVSSLSGTGWVLEIPTQSGSWTGVETSNGLVGTNPAGRTSRVFRLRNTGAGALAVGEFAIDGAIQGGAPSAGQWPQSGGQFILSPNYSASAYALQLNAASADPYRNRVEYRPDGALPDGIAVSSDGLLTIPPGLSAPARGWSIGIVLTNSLGRSSRVEYVLYDNTVFGIVQNGSGRSWSDGTFAATCAAYRNPTGRYGYKGMTGDGIYTIDPDGSGPVAPLNITCIDMDKTDIVPGTVAHILVTGFHYFPGHSTGSRVNWVQPWANDIYLALGKVSDEHSISAQITTEPRWDVTSMRDYYDREIYSCSGQCNGFTFQHKRDSTRLFWSDVYSTDGNTNGGPGLYIYSGSVTFR